MTRSALPPQPEVPESTASELQALYREAAHAEPDAMLDRRILDAARAELRSAGGARARRWWRGWLPAASALAIALVGLSVTWRVMDQQERDLRQQMKAAEPVRERSVAAPGRVAPAQEAADAQPLPRAPAPLAPGVANEALKKTDRAENEELRQRRDASAAKESASSPARQAGKLEADSPAPGASGETAADSLAGPSANSVADSAAKSAVGSVSPLPPDAATPEAWLKQIRELRAAGRGAEAAQSLARFRARYADFVLPDDLRDPK